MNPILSQQVLQASNQGRCVFHLNSDVFENGQLGATHSCLFCPGPRISSPRRMMMITKGGARKHTAISEGSAE